MSKRLPKTEHPERIEVGNETFERNDITAARFGSCTKTLDRQDKRGAPYILVAGIKYRPVERYDQFVLGQIKQAVPTAKKRAAS